MTVLEQFAADYRKAVSIGNAPDYGEVVDVHAIAGRYGTAILVEFASGEYLSPYFSQNDSEGDCYGEYGGVCGAPGNCENGWCGSDRFAIAQDSDEWLDTMAGATNWSEWEWTDASPSVV